MEKRRKYSQFKCKNGKTYNVRSKLAKVEIRVVDQVIVLKMDLKDLLGRIDEWTDKYEYDYFRDADAKERMLRPPWEKPGFPHIPSEKLEYIRVEQNFTQVALAERAGITQANLSAMENGKRPIGKAMAIRLGDALDVDYRIFLD